MSEGAGLPRAARRPAAHRRPGLVVLCAAYRAVAALVVALPASVFAGRALGGYPDGDASLFERGGLMLVETLRTGRPTLIPLAVSAATSMLLATLLGLVPLAALIAGLGEAGRLAPRALLRRATEPLGTLSLLWGSAVCAEGMLGLLVVLGARAGGPGWVAPALLLLGLAGVLAIGVLHDLARVAAVHRSELFYCACASALRTARARGGPAAWAYTWRASLAVAVIAAAFALAPPLGSANAARLAGLALVDQLALVAVVFLRASWLAAAIHAVDASAPREP